MQIHQQRSTNVVGGANRILFNNAVDTTTTSGVLHLMELNLMLLGNIRANNLTFGLTSGTTINTASGDLILDSQIIKLYHCKC